MVALACLALPLILFGCTLKDQNGDPITVGEIVGSNDLTVPKYLSDADLICREEPGNKPCYCMACENKTSYSFLGWLFNYYDSNLAGGNCSIAPCNQTDYAEIVQSDNDTQMRSFMMGMGQSFVSTGNANLYCNYTMQLATKWMKGTDGSPPRVPMVSRATCYLQRNALPLYIYYTEGKEISQVRTQEIADSFQGADAGPAIVTTEVWLNSSNDADVASVKQQIHSLRTCEKCLVVLAVKPNDYIALYKILGVPPNGIDHSIYDKIDAVGFGFRANDYAHCDADRIVYENLNFSRYILKSYSKPTIWLYVGASEGNSSDGSCQWDSIMVGNFYQNLMSQTGGLASSGVLGMGFYEFLDRSGSLPCNGVQGCDYGVINSSGGQKHPAMNAWSGMCQEIGTNSEYRTPLIFSKNAQGSACEMMRNQDAASQSSLWIESDLGLSSQDVVPVARIALLGCGEACPAEMPMPSVYDNAGTGFDPGHCDLYPIINERADDADISGSYMLAEFEQESGLNRSAVSNASASNPGCNPDSLPIEEICAYAGVAPSDCPAFNHPTGQKPCAFGLAQCIEYPGGYYADNGIPLTDSRMQYIRNCGGYDYNPFDPGMSACCGTNKFAAFLDIARQYVNSHWSQLSDCAPDGMVQGEQGWAAHYLASNMYFGTVWDALPAFITQRDNGTACSGTYKHYIGFLKNNVTAIPAPGTKYGAQVMTRYRAAVSACESECPT